MTLEELSILYTADVAPALESIHLLSRQMASAGAEMENMEQAFAAAGLQAAQGLAQGILSGHAAVMAAARQVADAAAQALREALRIHSPSKVTEDAGVQFDQGLAQGILSGTDTVQSAVDALAGGQGAVQSGLSALPDGTADGFGDMHLTIPIEIDGYQLGLAAIDGIHRVGRASGRAEIVI